MEEIESELYFNVMGMGKASPANIPPNAFIHIVDEMSKTNGETVRVGFCPKMGTFSGVTGDNELEGHEKQLSYYYDTFSIDQWRNAVRLKGRLDEQKSAYNLRTNAKNMLGINSREFIERQFFLKLAGVTNPTLYDVNGVLITGVMEDGTYPCDWSNTPVYIPNADEAAGDGKRYLCADASGTDSIETTDIITPDLVSRCKIKARNASPKIEAVQYKGKEYFLLLVHDYQMYDLKKNAIMAQALRDAWWRGEDNPLFSNADLVWDGVIIHSHEYVPVLDISKAGYSFRGSATGNQAQADLFRALFLGKQAAVWVRCPNSNPQWEERDFDYGNKWAISCGIMGGIDKLMFNSLERGVICLDTSSSLIIPA
jgi:N4-gp56 family major capsid protein